ncbi:MAG: hypothetical protein AB8C95_08595 [Phycisphaeraceae bacterium]
MGISFWLAVNNASLNAPPNPVFLFFWIGLAFAIFGTLAAKLIHAIQSRPDGCLSHLPTVKPIQVKTTFMGKAKAAEYDFAHPIYVEQLAAMNPPEIVLINKKKLQLQVDRFESRCADQ